MTHIFISYSKKNKDYAQALKAKLLSEGFTVWIDEVIEPSDNWWESIVSAIQNCAALIVIMTPEARETKWVQREVALGEQWNKPMFPLLRDGQNWPIFVLTQHEAVTNGNLPPDRFYRALAKYAPRQTHGSDITPTQPKTDSMLPNTYAFTSTHPISVTDVIPPPFEWCTIPSGWVTLEDSSNPKKYFGVEGTVGTKGGIYRVESFTIAKYPVTNAQYEMFVQEGYKDSLWWEYSLEAQKWHAENIRSITASSTGHDLPRTNVNWYDAMAYCRWLSYRTHLKITLPTEQQWQRAAQGDDERAYPWGNQFDKSFCNFNSEALTPVTSYPNGGSPFDVMDMSGNVWEWCLNEWGTDSVGLVGNKPRVLRGGSWRSIYPVILRVAFRARYNADLFDKDRGFRIVHSYP